jgi:hypothetical protein
MRDFGRALREAAAWFGLIHRDDRTTKRGHKPSTLVAGAAISLAGAGAAIADGNGLGGTIGAVVTAAFGGVTLGAWFQSRRRRPGGRRTE